MWSKEDARRFARQQRREAQRSGRPDAFMDPSQRTVFTELMKRLDTPTSKSTIAMYVSSTREPPTHEIISTLVALPVRVVVPRVPSHQRALQWVEVDETSAWEPDERGLWAPLGQDVGLDGCSVIVVPALRVSAAGDRLGQGGGYYDRALATVAPHAQGGPWRIGLVFDHELTAETDWYTEPHDETLDLVLTLPLSRHPQPGRAPTPTDPQ